MYGVFVNDDGRVNYAMAIVGRYKPIETRSRDMLRKCVGFRVAVVRTHRGKKPTIVGYVDIVMAEQHDALWMDAHRNLTLIPEGSKYDTGRKWCYFLENAEKCEPYQLPSSAIRHGRSWCEFEREA